MDPVQVTELLGRVERGEAGAAEDLYGRVYDDLRRRAHGMLLDRPGAPLQPTEVVHEAWLRLNGGAASAAQNRRHFFGIAAKVMRSVLVDRAREQGAQKRGGGQERVVLDQALSVYEERAPDLVALDELLDRLADLEPRLARIVELRFFGGLSIDETAEVLEVGHSTVERGWAAARAWLRGHLEGDEHAAES